MLIIKLLQSSIVVLGVVCAGAVTAILHILFLNVIGLG